MVAICKKPDREILREKAIMERGTGQDTCRLDYPENDADAKEDQKADDYFLSLMRRDAPKRDQDRCRRKQREQRIPREPGHQRDGTPWLVKPGSIGRFGKTPVAGKRGPDIGRQWHELHADRNGKAKQKQRRNRH